LRAASVAPAILEARGVEPALFWRAFGTEGPLHSDLKKEKRRLRPPAAARLCASS
jgi:hypothetical protein